MPAEKNLWTRKQRKELARRLQSADPGLEVIHPHAAGIDVGNEAHYVAVRPDRDSNRCEDSDVLLPIYTIWLTG